MKCILSGEVNTSNNSVDLSSFGFTSENDYVVILNGTLSAGTDNKAIWLESKTATGFSVYVAGNYALLASYQVLA